MNLADWRSSSMFSNLPSFLRLSLCLVLSTGLHGGLFFYDWMSSPVELRLSHAPVVVSFLPAIDIPSPVVSERAQETPVPAPSIAAPRSLEAKTASHVSRPLASVPRQAPAETSPGKVLPAAGDKKKTQPTLKMPSTEMVCMTPQDILFESPAGALDNSVSDLEPTDAEQVLAEASSTVPQVALPGVEEGLLDSADSSSQALIQATPKGYRNPLPEYPYMARQKHLEGVVWLLVDVSADGLVDDLRVEQSCGHRVLDLSARRTVKRWLFSPATRAGLAVSSQVRIPVRFRLEDG
jgi:protein TonB